MNLQIQLNPYEKSSMMFLYNFKILLSYCLIIVKASLVAQLIKNLPAIQETLVQFLGREDPLEKG